MNSAASHIHLISSSHFHCLVAIMVFQIQPSNKGRKKALSRRRKQGSTFAAHRDALDADPDQPPDTANDPTAASSHPASQNRKDNNWRSNRAVKAAKRATAKAIAERDAGREDNIISMMPFLVSSRYSTSNTTWRGRPSALMPPSLASSHLLVTF